MRRRTFLGTAAAAGLFGLLTRAFGQTQQQQSDSQLASDSEKETAPTPILDLKKIAPDFKFRLGSKIIGIDIDLLGPNGELTVAFIASLDTFHGDDWKKLSKENLASQNPFRIHEFLSHIAGHEIDLKEVEKICNLAQHQWEKKYLPQPEDKPKIPSLEKS